MRTFGAHGLQSDLSRREIAKKNLIVPNDEPLDALRRSGLWGVIDGFWIYKIIPYFLKRLTQLRLKNALGESATIGEEKRFELMNHDIRDKMVDCHFAIQRFQNIRVHPSLNEIRPGLLSFQLGFRAPWPSSVSLLWEPIVINHGRRDATGVLEQMTSDIFPKGAPRANPAPFRTQTNIAQQSWLNGFESDSPKMWSQDLLDEHLFSLALYMD